MKNYEQVLLSRNCCIYELKKCLYYNELHYVSDELAGKKQKSK